MGCGVIATINDTKSIIKHNKNNFSNKRIETLKQINSIRGSQILKETEKSQIYLVNQIKQQNQEQKHHQTIKLDIQSHETHKNPTKQEKKINLQSSILKSNKTTQKITSPKTQTNLTNKNVHIAEKQIKQTKSPINKAPQTITKQKPGSSQSSKMLNNKMKSNLKIKEVKKSQKQLIIYKQQSKTPIQKQTLKIQKQSIQNHQQIPQSKQIQINAIQSKEICEINSVIPQSKLPISKQNQNGSKKYQEGMKISKNERQFINQLQKIQNLQKSAQQNKIQVIGVIQGKKKQQKQNRSIEFVNQALALSNKFKQSKKQIQIIGLNGRPSNKVINQSKVSLTSKNKINKQGNKTFEIEKKVQKKKSEIEIQQGYHKSNLKEIFTATQSNNRQGKKNSTKSKGNSTKILKNSAPNSFVNKENNLSQKPQESRIVNVKQFLITKNDKPKQIPRNLQIESSKIELNKMKEERQKKMKEIQHERREMMQKKKLQQKLMIEEKVKQQIKRRIEQQQQKKRIIQEQRRRLALQKQKKFKTQEKKLKKIYSIQN